MTDIVIQRAAQLPDENSVLAAVVDNLTDDAAKLIYADWLEEHNDQERAQFMRDYVAACKSMDADRFPSMDHLPVEWCRAVGARLVRAIAEQADSVPAVADYRDPWLQLAQPALIYEDGELPDVLNSNDDDTTAIGASKRYGIPDLPTGTPWPVQRDCRHLYDDHSGIDPDLPCGFVGQMNFADLQGTLVARQMPASGLLSIFSCSEIDSIGMVDGLLIYTPDTSELTRLSAPESLMGDLAEEANMLLLPAAWELSETLELPYPGEESPFEAARFGYKDPLYDAYDAVMDGVDGDHRLSSIGGFTRATTGDDPLPGADWCKLICIQNSIEIVLHFCIPKEALKAGRFDQAKLAWVDFD